MEHTLDQFGKEKITPHPTRTAAIVLAAGQGKRMKSKIQKQFLLLEEKPVIWYALHAFEESRVDDVILVTGADEIAYCRDEIVGKYGFSKVRAIVAGGKERYHSVYEGLKALGSQLSYGEGDCVLIHDGARPFVDEPMIERIVSDIRSYSAAVAGMPSKDTVKPGGCGRICLCDAGTGVCLDDSDTAGIYLPADPRGVRQDDESGRVPAGSDG